ncbi:hypothetical protein LCGC14_2374740, partial [marine sediment metagenome]
ADIVTATAGAGLTATAGVLAVLVDSAEITGGAVDVDHLGDYRVTDTVGGITVAIAPGSIRNDNAVATTSPANLLLTDNATNFVEVDSAGAVTANTSAFTAGRVPLAEVVTVSADITGVTDKRAWLDVEVATAGALTEGDFVDNEVPSGNLDGADTTYTLANAPSPAASLKVYLNGIRQDEGASDDYTLTSLTITFAAAPISTDKVLADYRF